jgi:hypothetical protein
MMRAACKRNCLNTALAGELTVAKLKLLNERFNKAYTNWYQDIRTPKARSKLAGLRINLRHTIGY